MSIVTFNNLPEKIKASAGESIYEDIYVVNCGTVPSYHVSLKASCNIPDAEVTVYPDSVYKINASRREEFQVRIKFPKSMDPGKHKLSLKIDNMENLTEEETVMVNVSSSELNIQAINQVLRSRKD